MATVLRFIWTGYPYAFRVLHVNIRQFIGVAGILCVKVETKRVSFAVGVMVASHNAREAFHLPRNRSGHPAISNETTENKP